ncbi:MAG: hypothetical protein KAV82_00865 [Phycisphaerae bacterium]|nr:hypothetical protein [Phycisphaerae bacterium]
MRNARCFSRVWLCGVLVLIGAVDLPASTEILDLGGNQYRVTFRLKAPAGIRTVHLAGTFNAWDPHAQTMQGPDKGNTFATSLILGKGRFEYKFVLDGQRWTTDPDNPHKTPGYQNAILYLGIEPPDKPGGAVSPPKPVEMAGRVEHPTVLKQLLKSLVGRAGVADMLGKWFSEHPMPLFTASSVTFVYADQQASEVFVQILGYGSQAGYELGRPAKGSPVFAVSLDRAKLPERMAYTFEVQRGDQPKTITDPHAWSLTSRSGKPAALAVEASDTRGRIEVIPGFQPSSSRLPPRDVYIYLPPGYDRDREQRYPVLYIHDGQNCWDDPTEPFGHGGWCVNLTADRLINTGKVAPFIVVGIANTPQRMREYGPGNNILSDTDHEYIQFLKGDLKRRIDRDYRTLPHARHTALMGSSMGGLISMQAALLNPQTFGMAACLSPAFGFSDKSARGYEGLVRKVGKVPVRLYVDSGTAGSWQDGAPLTRGMANLLRETGWADGKDFMHFEDTDAGHNERAWRGRLEKPLLFLFGR